MEATNYISEMRDWLCECVWVDVEEEDIRDMSDATIIRAVARHYAGGLDGFILSCQPVKV